MKKCPYCAEDIQDEAIKCRYCGEWLKETKLPPLDSDDFIKQKERRHIEEKVSQIRPWLRFWARMFDICLFSLVIGIILSIIAPSLFKLDIINNILLGMGILFMWVFVEAPLLSSYGATPGKWLLGIKVRFSDGEKLNDAQAFKRGFAVWAEGLGLGLPFVNLITLGNAFSELKRNGITSWDKRGGFVVSHKKINSSRIIVMILFFIGCYLLYLASRTSGTIYRAL